MSLAIGPPCNGDRPVSILPAITCSSCGAEIAIAAMGEHICAPDAPSQLPPSRTKSRTFSMSSLKLRKLSISGRAPTIIHPPMPTNDLYLPASTTTTSWKQTRLPPLNIDPEIANRLAPAQGAITSPFLSSPHNARAESRPADRPPVARSTTTPSPYSHDNRPPSTAFTPNLDCAFPPFPTSNSSPHGRSSPSSGRITPVGGDQPPFRSASRLDQCQTLATRPNDLEARSPGVQGGENVLQKLNTLKSGPFDAVRRQGSGASEADQGKRQPSRYQSTDHSSESPSPPLQHLPTAATTQESLRTTSHGKKTPPPRPARTSADTLSPEFLEQFNSEPSSFITRSPAELEQQKDADEALRSSVDEQSQTSTPTTRDEQSRRFPRRKESLAVNVIPDCPTPRIELVPPRAASQNGDQRDFEYENSPPAPASAYETRKYGGHTPSESSSSATSTHLSGSSVASPYSSAASSIGAFSPLAFDQHEFADEKTMQSSGSNMRNPLKPGLRAEMPARPKTPKDSPPADLPARVSPPTESPPRDLHSMDSISEAQGHSVESPMDPTFQQSSTYGRSHALTTTRAPLPAPLTLSSSLVTCSSALPSPAISAFGGALAQTPSPTATNLSVGRPSARPRVKPNCRGCGLVIEGKSVKAADGRLTGRWHKACFVCRSCQEPFATADFYVINNEPYCEHHYHEENGSLCHGCNRGIEGQYLETTSSSQHGSTDRKYHPKCFTCSECRQVLVDDYFEIQSRVYCERHALYAMRSQHRQQGPPTTGTALTPYGQNDRRQLMAERRTTRLINPMMA